MLTVRLLQAPAGRLRCVVGRSLSPAPPPAVNLSVALRTWSNVSSLSPTGTSSGPHSLTGGRVLLDPGTRLRSWPRSMSGSPTSDRWGWYSSLAESGPVRLCEQYLMGVQQLTGFPWWLSIIVATLTVRTLITLPLAAYQLVIIAKVEALQAEIAQLAKRLRYEVSVRAKERGWTEKEKRFQFQKNLRHLVSQLYIRDNCHPFKASLLVWVQLPLWVSLSLALRNLSLGEPAVQAALAAGGALWVPDLTSPDSTWILPVCLGLTNLLIVEVFSLQKLGQSRVQRFSTNLIRGFSVVMVPVAASVPSAMALYWFSSSLVGLCHNLLLRSPALRRGLKLPAQPSDAPYRDLLAALVNKYCK